MAPSATAAAHGISGIKARTTHATAAQPMVELAQTDVVQAQLRELQRGLPVSGSLKAVNSAFVKARIPGELQGLAVREGDTVKAGQVIARGDPLEVGAPSQRQTVRPPQSFGRPVERVEAIHRREEVAEIATTRSGRGGVGQQKGKDSGAHEVSDCFGEVR